MKRLGSTCLLILCLSLPVFAGHTAVGGYCAPCDVPGCTCDPGEDPRGGGLASRMAENEDSQNVPADIGTEALLVLAVFLLVLRYKS